MPASPAWHLDEPGSPDGAQRSECSPGSPVQEVWGELLSSRLPWLCGSAAPAGAKGLFFLKCLFQWSIPPF